HSRSSTTPHAGRILHDRRHGNAHYGECTNQFATNYGNRGEQELFSLLVRLRQYRKTVIEGIEQLCQLKHVFREVGWLSRCNALPDYVRGLGSSQPELPDFVSAFAIQIACQVRGRNAALLGKIFGIDSCLPEDAAGAYNRILRVRTRFSLETERVFKV